MSQSLYVVYLFIFCRFSHLWFYNRNDQNFLKLLALFAMIYFLRSLHFRKRSPCQDFVAHFNRQLPHTSEGPSLLSRCLVVFSSIALRFPCLFTSSQNCFKYFSIIFLIFQICWYSVDLSLKHLRIPYLTQVGVHIDWANYSIRCQRSLRSQCCPTKENILGLEVELECGGLKTSVRNIIWRRYVAQV